MSFEDTFLLFMCVKVRFQHTHLVCCHVKFLQTAVRPMTIRQYIILFVCLFGKIVSPTSQLQSNSYWLWYNFRCHLPFLYIGLEYGLTSTTKLAEKFFLQAQAIAPDDPFVVHEIGVIEYQNGRSVINSTILTQIEYNNV